MLFFVVNEKDLINCLLFSVLSQKFHRIYTCSTLALFFFLTVERENTVTENPEALFGKTKYNFLETRLNSFANCFWRYLPSIHAHQWPICKNL